MSIMCANAPQHKVNPNFTGIFPGPTSGGRGRAGFPMLPRSARHPAPGQEGRNPQLGCPTMALQEEQESRAQPSGPPLALPQAGPPEMPLDPRA